VYFYSLPSVNLSEDELTSSNVLDAINKDRMVLNAARVSSLLSFRGRYCPKSMKYGRAASRPRTKKEVKTDCTECALEAVG